MDITNDYKNIIANTALSIENNNLRSDLKRKDIEIYRLNGKLNSVKMGERKLADGSREIRKSNKNGTLMLKKFGSNNQLDFFEVTQLDGSKRKTKFNIKSGIRNFTKTNTNGEKTYKYNSVGEYKPLLEIPFIKTL